MDGKYKRKKSGILTVYAGCMFAGKTDAIIEKIQDLSQKNKSILVLKPKIDSRSGSSLIKSLTGKCWLAKSVSSSAALIKCIQSPRKFKYLFIDETQFFSSRILPAIDAVLNDGIDVYIGGLDRGFSDHNLPVMNQLMALADVVIKYFAHCSLCNALANKTQRIDKNKKPIAPHQIIRKNSDLVGGTDEYEPRCRQCYIAFSWSKKSH